MSRLKNFFTLASLLCLFTIPMPLHGVTLEEKLGGRYQEEDTFHNREVMRTEEDALSGKTAVVVKDKVIYKDPRLSCILSFVVPGMGEYYLRNDVKGTIFFLTTTSAYVLSLYYLYQGIQAGAAGKSKVVVGAVGSIAAVVLHIVGMVESYNDAVELNEARFYMTE